MKLLSVFCLLFQTVACFCQPAGQAVIISQTDSLNKAAEALGNAGKIEEGIAVVKQAGEFALQNLGAEHEQYAASLSVLGVLHYQAGRYADAEPLFRQAKNIYEKSVGRESIGYATNADNLGEMYRLAGRYAEAEPLFLEALNLRRKMLGERHFDYAVSQNNLANLYANTARFEEAEPLFVQSKDLLVELLGEENLNSAFIISNLATFYENLGRYEEAEPLFVKSNLLLEKLLGEHYIFATNLNNLAALYARTGRFGLAETLYERAKAMREKTLGKAHRDYFQSLNNMAEMYRLTKRYTEAEAFLTEALELARKKDDTGHPDFATMLNNLANLYQDLGQFEKAEKTYLDGCASLKLTLGIEHPYYAVCLNNLANFYGNTGRAEKAIPLCQEALATLAKTVGREHSLYLTCLNNLALLYQSLGENEAAEAAFLEGNATQRSLLAKSTRYLSEREKASYLNLFLSDLDAFLSFLQSTNSSTASNMTAAAFDNALFHKGFLLLADMKMRQLVTADPASEQDFLLFLAYHRRIATELAKPLADRQNLDSLEAQANTLEKKLTRTVAGFGNAIRQVNWKEVRQQLQSGEAVVEFIHYQFHKPEITDSIVYAALVLRPGDAAPVFVPLFEQRQLEALMQGNPDNTEEDDIRLLYSAQPSGKGRQLYDLIWKPLEKLLQGTQKIYCSPSGALHQFNLSAIPAVGGIPFGEQHDLVLLGSTRQLVVLAAAVPATPTAWLAGGIRYETDTTTISPVSTDLISGRGQALPDVFHFSSDSTSRGDVWGYLPNSLEEVNTVNKLLQKANYNVQLATGYTASEEAFKNLGAGQPSPEILLVSTHGFFYSDPDIVQKGKRKSAAGEQIFRQSRHPMMRSGLILAGAQQAWTTGKPLENREDGILTAYEISQMNLNNTELVVLSACETARGEIQGNEGVYGFQRAFKIAGVKYLIISLWSVNDKSTRQFITEFFKQWQQEKLPVPDAFREAQRQMRLQYLGSPFHWAGFVLVE